MLKAADLFFVPDAASRPSCFDDHLMEVLQSYWAHGFDCPEKIASDVYEGCLDWLTPGQIDPTFVADLSELFELVWIKAMRVQPM